MYRTYKRQGIELRLMGNMKLLIYVAHISREILNTVLLGKNIKLFLAD